MQASKGSTGRAEKKPLLVLVTGVTGHQGGQVARHLLQHAHRVRAVVRDPQSPKLADIRSKGIEVQQGSFDDPSTIERAVQGVDAMFLMGTPYGGGPEQETRQGIAAIDAAKAAGVPWLVYSSVGDANRKTGVPHFDSKFAVEEHLRKSGVPYAISAPAAFMENFVARFNLPSIKQGKLMGGTSPDRKVKMVALEDLGAFDSLVLENPSRFHGKRVDIASDAVSQAEAARKISELTGRTIEYQQLPLEALRAQSADMAKMVEWFERAGYTADIEGLRREYPEVGWHRFPDWAAQQPWARLVS
ncbi:MAG: NmrA/HSCARG family protein [Thermoplasmata archaeon]